MINIKWWHKKSVGPAGTPRLDVGTATQASPGVGILDEDAVHEPPAAGSSKPDPAEVHTVAQLRQALIRYKSWADLSYRDIAKTCDHSHSTIRTAATGNGTTPPRLGILRAYVRACGADDTEVAHWDEAWRRLNHTSEPAADGTTAPAGPVRHGE
ncbi:helix-turn-helix domain-containing protein [Actinomadura rubrisoli]|uniref:XRE family transcriptional regulator n=1 Tax=Actinomadura rubrisoli TaxID=2530368 RepID=A0A4R5CAR4_9ACTN|nr:helix-turn-helix domain-containing protein [Actinomadura rubrisoli]TDD95290.1 XRE family transcriptional regulator [Actinomadura rubrisoli]